MKKLLALMLVLAMVFALCACGGKGEKAPAEVAGRYYLVRAEENGTTYTLDDIAEMAGGTIVLMYVDLFADGTGYVFSTVDGDDFGYDLCWGNGKMWKPEFPDEIIFYTISGNTLTIINDGLKEIFVKD